MLCAKRMHGPELKAVWVFVLCEITWSVKGAPSVLLQSFWTTSIYRILYFKRSAFITIFSDIFTAHVHLRRNGYFWTCGVNLDTNMVGYVTNLATKFQHPTPIRSWFITFPLVTIENAFAATAHAPNHVTGEYGVRSLAQICLFAVQLLWGYNDDKGSFTLERPQC